jgi:hypothetical protein
MQEGFVVVGSFDCQPRAGVAKALLEAEGLTVVMTDVEVTSGNPLRRGWTGGIKLWVPEAQAAAATRLLATLPKSTGHGTSHVPGDACLACGAPMTPDQSACTHCGWSFVA